MTKWLIQSNPRMFDAVNAFAALGSIDWKQVINAEIDDVVYVYVAAPVKAIMLKCKVIRTNLSSSEIDDSEYVLDGATFENYGKYMRLSKVAGFSENLLPYEKLKQHGLKSVQGPMRLTGELEKYVESFGSNGVEDTINIALKPIDILQEADGEKIVCPNCKTKFKRAMRCPECGQLILYKEKWNKPKLTDLDDWIAASNIDGATSREVGDFVRKVCANDGFSYHVGAVDLSLDIVDSDNMTIMSVLMLFGKGDSFAFQPLALEGGADKYHLKKDAITDFLEKMKLFLIPDQKNKPYERYNGYYYIDYKTLVEKAAEIERILIDFKNAL